MCSLLVFSREVSEEIKQASTYLQHAKELVEMNDALDDLLPEEHNGNTSQDRAPEPTCLPSDQITS